MYYFVSDIHLGLGTDEESRKRELLFIKWLEDASKNAKGIFIVGDMLDFWYEYRRVVPKGFTRLLGALSSLTDKGVPIHFLPGNHDMWAYSYLHDECGITIHHDPVEIELYGKRLFITHGDDITAKEKGFWTKVMNAMFRSRPLRWLFSHLVHPTFALKLGHEWSAKSRKSKSITHTFLKEEEPMVRFAKRVLQAKEFDYFIFGHNHCAEIYGLSEKSSAVFLGEWIERPAYAALSPDGSIGLHKVI